MLANVLPGIRELRAPLAAGYLWLLCAWLAFGGLVPAADHVHHGTLHRLYDLEPVISRFGLAVAVSVAAYVVGSIAIDVQKATRLPVDRLLRLPAFMTGEGDLILSAAGERQLARLRDAGIERREILAPGARDVLKTRILDHSPALYSEIDRADAEAAFRFALWPPLGFLVLAFAVGVSPWWLLADILPAVLVWQRLVLLRQANDALVTAVAARPEVAGLAESVR